MSNNYFRFDTTLIKSGGKGGRLFSTKPTVDTELPNGVFGYMGSYIDSEIRELLIPTTDLIKNSIPVVIHNPEISYKEYLKSDNALGIYRNKAGKVLRTFPLEQYDLGSFSQDYFDLTGKVAGKTTEIEKGDMFILQANLVAGTQLKYSATVPTSATNKVYFKIAGVSNSGIPIFYSGTGSLFPQAYKIAELEMILA